eukprot:356323-Chlamydomonas_euryale.AAC.1
MVPSLSSSRPLDSPRASSRSTATLLGTVNTSTPSHGLTCVGEEGVQLVRQRIRPVWWHECRLSSKWRPSPCGANSSAMNSAASGVAVAPAAPHCMRLEPDMHPRGIQGPLGWRSATRPCAMVYLLWAPAALPRWPPAVAISAPWPRTPQAGPACAGSRQ